MPVLINDSALVPAPLVTFSKQYINAGDGIRIGATYTVELNGTILPNKGNPVVDSGTLVSTFSGDSWATSQSPDDDPLHGVTQTDSLQSIMSKQEQIRAVFSQNSAVKVEITDWGGNDRGIKFIGQVQSISFPNEGRWVMPCPYSVVLTTTSFSESVDSGQFSDDSTEDEFTYYVSTANESWGIEESEEKIYLLEDTGGPNNHNNSLKVYRISHNMSAQGVPAFTNESGIYASGWQPWEQAKGYVQNTLGLGSTNLPSGIIDVIGANYSIADRTITESVDVKGGSYSVTENMVAYPSGSFLPYPAVLTTEVNVNRGEDGSTKVDINGLIRGLNTVEPDGTGNISYTSHYYPQDATVTEASRVSTNAFFNARQFYNDLTSNNRIYHAARMSSEMTWLHPLPLVKSEGVNVNAGTLSFSYAFDDRPPNLISGSVAENIDVRDTYPGQVIATIPVIGRSQPIIQYLNTRTEYKRTLTIAAAMGPISGTSNWLSDSGGIIASGGYWNVGGYAQITQWGQRKPSVLANSDLSKIFEAFNPANEAGVNGSGVYHTAPEESWNPRTGAYTYTVSWIYTV